jgi:hypothetical protein
VVTSQRQKHQKTTIPSTILDNKYNNNDTIKLYNTNDYEKDNTFNYPRPAGHVPGSGTVR